MRLSVRLCALTVVMLAAGLPVIADASIRCGGNILQRGDSTFDLLAICGEPDAVQTLETGPFHPDAARRLIAVREEWFYDYGSGQIPRIVHLQAGKVVRVEQGRRR